MQADPAGPPVGPGARRLRPGYPAGPGLPALPRRRRPPQHTPSPRPAPSPSDDVQQGADPVALPVGRSRRHRLRIALADIGTARPDCPSRWCAALLAFRPGPASAQPEAGRAVEELAGDLQMSRMRRGLLDDVQDHHADAGYLLTPMAAPRHVRQAETGEYLVGPVALLPVVAEHL